MNNQAGKGDKPRPVNKPTFDANYEHINWNTAEKKMKVSQIVSEKTKTTYKY
jgi:hypothetical protein